MTDLMMWQCETCGLLLAKPRGSALTPTPPGPFSNQSCTLSVGVQNVRVHAWQPAQPVTSDQGEMALT